MVPARYHGKQERKKERWVFKNNGMPTPVGVSFLKK
jgi:hypothetical protein